MSEASAEKKAPESKKTEEKPKDKAKLAAVPNEPHGAGDAQAKPKKDMLTVSILGLSVLNVGMIVALGLNVMKLSSKVAEVQQKTTEVIELANAEEKEREEAKQKRKALEAKLLGKELEAPAQGTLYPMDSFLVNISSDQGSKFLQIQMELELSDPSVEEEVTKKRAALRDGIIVLLSSKSYKELKEPNGMKALRTEVTKSLNGLLSTGKIKEVYFTQFHFN
jgi:flagellar FliL protein